MAIQQIPLFIKQGATYRHRFTLYDRNRALFSLANATSARMHIRKSAVSDEIFSELTTANGGIVLGGANATVDLYIDKTETSDFNWKGGVYDLLIDWASGDTTCYFEGPVSVSPLVTHNA